MKNREKYREEIVKNARAAGEEVRISACEFINRIVLPTFGDGVSCFTINCAWCKILLGIWLDEEYEEPPKPEVDWNKVPVDTLVRVRDSVSEDWRLMYFKELRTDYIYNRHITWKDGKTSKTAEGDCVGWQYCELVEEEDDEE